MNHRQRVPVEGVGGTANQVALCGESGSGGFREHCLSSAIAKRLLNELRSGRCRSPRSDRPSSPHARPEPGHFSQPAIAVASHLSDSKPKGRSA